jgi:hypothetical protein
MMMMSHHKSLTIADSAPLYDRLPFHSILEQQNDNPPPESYRRRREAQQASTTRLDDIRITFSASQQ